MKKRFYLALIVFAILVLALGRLIVCLPAALLGTAKGRRDPKSSHGLSTQFSTDLS